MAEPGSAQVNEDAGQLVLGPESIVLRPEAFEFRATRLNLALCADNVLLRRRGVLEELFEHVCVSVVRAKDRLQRVREAGAFRICKVRRSSLLQGCFCVAQDLGYRLLCIPSAGQRVPRNTKRVVMEPTLSSSTCSSSTSLARAFAILRRRSADV